MWQHQRPKITTQIPGKVLFSKYVPFKASYQSRTLSYFEETHCILYSNTAVTRLMGEHCLSQALSEEAAAVAWENRELRHEVL